MYGVNCSKSCGNCKNNQQCDHIDGTCMNGCENGYQGFKCDKGISQEKKNKTNVKITTANHLLKKFV